MLTEEKEKRAQCLSRRLEDIIEHKSPYACEINFKQQVEKVTKRKKELMK